MGAAKRPRGELPDFHEIGRGECPCGRQFYVGHTGGQPALAHQLPYCTNFLTRAPDDFLRWVRVEAECAAFRQPPAPAPN